MAEAIRYNFSGGMSRQHRPMLNEVRLIKNARPMPDGTIAVRKGYSLHASVGASGSTYYILSVFGYYSVETGQLIYSVKGGGSSDLIYKNGTEVTGDDFGADTNFTTIAAYKDYVFFSNGNSPIKYHSPTSSTQANISGSPTPPRGKFIYFHKDRCYVTNGDNVLYWSNVGMFSTLPTCDFPEYNFINLGRDETQTMGIISSQDYLVVFTTDSFHVMAGTPGDDGATGDMSWREFKGLGCLSSRSIALWPEGVVFVGNDKQIYSLKGLVAYNLDPKQKVAAYFNAVETAVARYISCKYYNGELWIYLPKSNNPQDGRILIYNPFTKAWAVFENINSYAFGQSEKTGSQLFAGSASGNSVWQLENGDDDVGSPIEFEVISRPEPLGSFRKMKSVTLISVQMNLSPEDSIAFTYDVDNAEAYTAFSSGTPLTSAGHNWGDENWGVSNWGGSPLKTTILRFASGVVIRAREFVLRLLGTASTGTRLLSYSVESDIDIRDD